MGKNTLTVADALSSDTPDRAVISTLMLSLSHDDAAAAYVAADRSGRATIRAAMQAALLAAVTAGDMTGAQDIITMTGDDNAPGVLRGAALAAQGSTAQPVAWSPVIAHRAAVLGRAALLLLSGDVRPEGMPDDAENVSSDDIMAAHDALLASFENDDDAADAVLAAAQAIAGQRVRRGGAQRDVSAYIAEHVARVIADGQGDDAGHVRHSVIRRGQDDAPSAGSVAQAWSAVMAGDRVIEGVVAVNDARGGQAWSLA